MSEDIEVGTKQGALTLDEARVLRGRERFAIAAEEVGLLPGLLVPLNEPPKTKPVEDTKMTVTIGQEVSYVPAHCYALDRHYDGGYAYELSETTGSSRPVPLTDKDVSDRIQSRTPGHAFVRGHPKRYWPAVVMAVHEDGRLDLDIQGPQGGVTLSHYKVPEDPDGLRPDSWHVTKDSE